jgi:endoglucanase
MFVEGVQLYPDASQSGGVDAYWWGSTLTGVRDFPVILNVPHQLVYSPHDWGPWKWNFPWFPQMTYASIQKVWHVHWSFIVQDPNAPYAAPIWIGEFGTCTNNPKCIDVQQPGNQATWFQFFLHYLRDNPNVGWSFFALNGSNSNDHAAFNGVTNPHWSTTANSKLQSYLAGVQG